MILIIALYLMTIGSVIEKLSDGVKRSRFQIFLDLLFGPIFMCIGLGVVLTFYVRNKYKP